MSLNSDILNVFEDEETNGWTCVTVDNERVWPLVKLNLVQYKTMRAREDVLAWLEEQVGPRVTMRTIGVWRHDFPLTATTTNFFFKDPSKALLFKLTWG